MLSSILVLLGAAILVTITFHTIRVPAIVAFFCAGVLVGPSGLALISSFPQVGLLTEIAAVLLMFTIGLEFSFKELSQFRRPMLILGVGQIFITITAFALIFWLGFSMSIEKAIFLGMLAAPSSTAVVLKLLYDHRDFESPYGKSAFSILLLQDLAIIPMIVAVPFLVSHNTLSDSFLDAAFPMLLLALLVTGLLYLIGRYGLPFLFHRVSQTRNREIFFFTVLLVCLGSAALMHTAGLSVSLGAFIAGMLLAGSHYGKQATAEILPLRDAFLSLFFISVGMMLDLQFLMNHWLTVLSLGLVVLSIKSLIIFSVIWLAGSPGSIARASTALLFQLGEFSFILAELGRQNNLMSEKERQIFLAIAILSLILTPFLYRRIGMIMKGSQFDRLPVGLVLQAEGLRKKLQRLLVKPLDMNQVRHEEALRDHVVVIGYGVAGQSLCRILEHLNIRYQVVELNPETVRIHSHRIPILFGDAANPQLLKKAGVEDARLVAIVTSGAHMMEPILNALAQANPHVPVVARTNYLLDLKRLNLPEKSTAVVSELEATLKIIEHSLLHLNVEKATTEQLVASLRAEF
jgi:monovalent cation:H+ antiporter-2, CPA2 family